ncbi:MAG: DUF1287 domain-containing protein [Henriciella sp.]|nr:DUF1287 domain-containing protein [Henriciella sp.]
MFHGMELTRRNALSGIFTIPLISNFSFGEIGRTANLITSARAQVGVTTMYDPAYVKLDYPGGDVSRERGVCIDVVIRAYRDSFEFDFQENIHLDMKTNFGLYPKTWGLTRTDRNIDHRRVPNMETWLQRHDHELPAKDWQPGDIITCRVGGRLPHIGILSNRRGRNGNLLAIHNIGLGTLEDSRIWDYGNRRRFRFLPG